MDGTTWCVCVCVCVCGVRDCAMHVEGLVGKLTNAGHQHWTLAMQRDIHRVQFPMADRLCRGALVDLSALDQ